MSITSCISRFLEIALSPSICALVRRLFNWVPVAVILEGMKVVSLEIRIAMIIKGIATDNLPNRNWGRFSLQELQRISTLLSGCPVSVDHNTDYASKRGTVTKAWVETGAYNSDIKESYACVKFEADISGVSPESGDGVSITVGYTLERCADCDCQVQDWTRCPRPLEQIKAKWIEREGVKDVLELSLVLIPAVKSAKVLDNGVNSGVGSIDSFDEVQGMGTIVSNDVVNGENPISKDEAVAEVPDTKPSFVALTPEEVEILAAREVEQNQIIDSLSAEIEEIKSRLAAQDEQLKSKDSELQAANLKAKLGLSMPSVNVLLSPSRDRTDGRLAEFEQILESSPQRTCFYGGGTRFLVQRDEVQAQRYWLENKAELTREMEKLAKDHGLLRGVLSRDTATVRTDIPDMFLTHLSMMVRTTHVTGTVFWQFPRVVDDFTKIPGDTINVPRWANVSRPTAEADFTLTPGTALAGTPQNLSQTSRPIVLEEKGLGKSGVSGFEPIGIPEFIAARSIQDLQRIVMERLGIHYEQCYDFLIRNRYQSTTAIRYNNNGATTATPGDVGVGDDGTLTEDFLHDLFSEMSSNFVPTYDDGCYIGALNPKAAAQVRKSIADRIRYMPYVDMSQVLLPQGTSGKVSGYIGTIAGFHLFQTNVFGVGNSGEGVQSVSLGVGSTLTRSSWFFGKDAVGLAVGMPMTIRANDDTSFGRLNQYIWLAHMAADTLDVDPNNDASEQLRVFQVRTIDVSV